MFKNILNLFKNKDKEYILEKIKIDDYDLNLLPKNLKKDKEIILNAVKNDCNNLYYV